MTNQKYHRSPVWMDPKKQHVTNPITAVTAQNALRNMQQQRLWQQQQMLAMYCGVNDEDYNGNFLSKFYIIQNYPSKPDAAATSDANRYLGGRVKFWPYIPSGAPSPDTISLDWWPDYTDAGTTNNILSFDYYSPLSVGVNDWAKGPIKDLGIQSYPTDAASHYEWNASLLQITNGIVAGLGVWTLPYKVIDEDLSYDVVRDNLTIDQVIRGYDGDVGNSLAVPIHRHDRYIAGSGNSDDQDSVVANGRRCMFQTCWPKSVYAEAQTSYIPLRGIYEGSTWYASSFKVKPRNLRGVSTDIRTLPSFILSTVRNSGSWSVQYRSVVAGDTWTCTDSTSLATPIHKINTDGTNLGAENYLDVDPDGDEIEIWVQTSTGGSDQILIHTVALFEDYNE